jgi:hypothetical protein
MGTYPTMSVGLCVTSMVATFISYTIAFAVTSIDISSVSRSSRLRHQIYTHITTQAACVLSSFNFCSVLVHGHHKAVTNVYEGRVDQDPERPREPRWTGRRHVADMELSKSVM